MSKLAKDEIIIHKFVLLLAVGFLSTTIISAYFLNTSVTRAVDSSATASVYVADACNLNKVVNTPHTATIPAGTYETDIGITTFKVTCNDYDGYSIYAIGYTNEEYGNTKLLATIGGSLAPSYDITTGTATSGNTSNWAMKINAVSGTYSPTIVGETQGDTDDFTNYHSVPTNFTKIASFPSSTDATTGSSIQATYAAFITGSQPAGTYDGKVRYIVVHPSSAPAPVQDNQIGVVYDGNGLTFPGGLSQNRVIYEKSCEDEYGYIADTPLIMRTRNLGFDGSWTGPYSYVGGDYYEGNFVNPNGIYFEEEPMPTKVKIVVTYGLTGGIDYGPDFDINGYSLDADKCGEFCDSSIDRAGTTTYIFNARDIGSHYDDYIEGIFIYMEGGSAEAHQGYDYGIYMQVYPIYDEPVSGTTYDVIQNVCSYSPVSGTYAETNPWYGYWYMTTDHHETYEFYYESVDEYDDDTYGVTKYLSEHSEELLGSNLILYAYNPYRILYNGNGATAGTMSDFDTWLDTNTSESMSNLLAPNFKKTGYGFAGWSANQNATVNSSDKIYGPNENITGDELTFNSSHETTLYAVWVQSVGTMQGWSGCSSMSSGQVTALTDNRDNNVYTIAKLPDGNCWMMENLRLDNTATTLSSSNTNNPDSNFTSLAATSDSWCYLITANPTCTNQSKLNTNNTNIGGANASGAILIPSPSNNDSWWGQEQWYSYGNYYNWYSATAGNGTYSTTTGNVTGDICPNGWSLPTGESGGQFSALDVAIGGTGVTQYTAESSNRWRTFPQNFIYSGKWVAGGASSGSNGLNYYGNYWSRTANTGSANNMRGGWILDIAVSSTNPTNIQSREYGATIRCLAQ